MENYEALGRYISAKEQAERFLSERDNALRGIKSVADRSITTSSGGGMFANGFDPTKLEELVKKATEANQNMLAAIDEANRNADDCEKTKLKLWDTNY